VNRTADDIRCDWPHAYVHTYTNVRPAPRATRTTKLKYSRAARIFVHVRSPRCRSVRPSVDHRRRSSVPYDGFDRWSSGGRRRMVVGSRCVRQKAIHSLVTKSDARTYPSYDGSRAVCTVRACERVCVRYVQYPSGQIDYSFNRAVFRGPLSTDE
jgi:hypothetical protein